MSENSKNGRPERIRRQVRQLILLRETGPKSAAWHAARARLIWHLQDQLRAERPEPRSGGAAEAADRES